MNVFFDDWLSLARTLIIGVGVYAGLILFLRISGKRTLSKMNAFDLVVTVALGSTLSTALLSKGTSLVDGLFALLLLVWLQFAVAWCSLRSDRFRRWVKSEPTLLFFRGEFLESRLCKERVVRDEVLSAIRGQGVMDLADVEAVVLETDGTFSVIRKAGETPVASALESVRA